jgi:hypothetical protein
MSKKVTNPFTKEESLKPFFEGDRGYVDTKNYQLERYIMKNKTTTQSIEAGFSLRTFFQSHLIASILAIGFVAGTFTVAAAELFAPVGIKPSSLITRRVQDEPVERPTEYQTQVDPFTFAYNSNNAELRVTGTAETSVSCYDVNTTSIVPTVSNEQVTYNLLIHFGLPLEDTPELDLSTCTQEPTSIEIEQTYDVTFEDSELDRFDSLFTTRVKEDEFDESEVTSRPFVSNDVYNVYVSQACDLAIKHPVAINFLGEIIGVGVTAETEALKFEDIGISYPLGDGFSGYSIQCNPVEELSERIEFYELWGNESIAAESTVQTIERDALCNVIDFTKQSCAIIQEDQIYKAELSGIEFYQDMYIFIANDTVYELGDSISSKNINSTPFRFQFDSLAPSESSTPVSVRVVEQDIEEPIVTNEPAAPYQGLFFRDEIPDDHFYRIDMCNVAQEPEVAVSYEANSTIFDRPNNQLFLPINFVDRIYGYELFPADNPMAFGFYIDCANKTDQTQTSTQYLEQFPEVGYAIENAEIRDVPQEELLIFANQTTIDLMENPKYIEIGTASKNPLRLIAFEYKDYIITIEYEHEVYKEYLNDLDSREIFIYLNSAGTNTQVVG